MAGKQGEARRRSNLHLTIFVSLFGERENKISHWDSGERDRERGAELQIPKSDLSPHPPLFTQYPFLGSSFDFDNFLLNSLAR